MTVPAIGAIGAALPTVPTVPAVPAAPSAAVGDAGQTSAPGSDFAHVLGKGLDSLQQTQDTADQLAVKAATGDLTDLSQYTVAATQASLATELAATLRTKAVDAFNEIMGLPA